MSQHARLGPSNARWPKCPGSVREEANYPDIAGDAAIDGTGSHLLLELCMDEFHDASFYVGTLIGVNHQDKPNGWLVDEVRAARVQMCLDYIDRRERELRKQFPDANISVNIDSESKSNPGGMFGRDDWWGTVDITITVTDELGNCLFLETIDYKDGRIWVKEKGNTQLLSYLGGKMRPFVCSGPELVRPFRPELIGGCRVTIVQPKTSPTIRYDNLTPEYVIRELEKLNKAAYATDDHDAPLIPGGHCQWCKHKKNCKAKSEKSLEVVKQMSNDLAVNEGKSLFEYIGAAVADPSSLPDDKLTELADARAGIEAVFDAVDAEIEKRIEAGNHVPGYGMLPGNNSQVWNEEEKEIVRVLKGRRMKKDDIYPAKLITPAQFMKSDMTDEQKAKIKKKYITIKGGDLKLTKVSREKPTTQSMFSDIPSKPVAKSMFSDIPSKPVSFF